MINFAVFALPIIIYHMGAKFMVNLGFNPLLSVNALLNKPSAVQWIIPVGVLISMILLTKYKKK